MIDVIAADMASFTQISASLGQLSTDITKAATYGMRFNNDMKGLVIMANVAHAAQQPWGSELAEVQRKIKEKYL